MRFNRKDQLQGRWAEAALGVKLDASTYWIPPTQAFIDLARAGIAWGLQPSALARPHLDAGTLVELLPGHSIKVPLFWTVSRLHVEALRLMTDAVRRSAKAYFAD